jgi:NAD(P)H-dependent FMN reductase
LILLSIDPLETPMELVALPFHFMPNPDDAPAWLKEMHEKIKTADGFIIVTAEYNSTLPPALANMIDHFPPASYRHRPCALVGYSMGKVKGQALNKGIQSRDI